MLLLRIEIILVSNPLLNHKFTGLPIFDFVFTKFTFSFWYIFVIVLEFFLV